MEIEDSLELGNLHHSDLVNEVFRRIPLKHLTRLKTVSKTWFNYITRHRTLTSPTTSSGILVFFQTTNPSSSATSHHKTVFLKLQDQEHCGFHGGGGGDGRGVALHRSFDNNRFMLLLDSCKELLLNATHDHTSWTYHVSSPFREHVSSRTFPPAHPISRPACPSLCFDGFGYSREFRVSCFFWEEVDTIAWTMNYLSFSSESWAWSEKKASIINPNPLLDDKFVRGQCFGARVYSRRKLYLLWSICLLIYHDEEEQLFELIRLPSTTMKDDNESSNTLNLSNAYLFRFLWESDGVIHFCDPVDEGYCVWTLEGGLGDRPWRFKWFLKLDEVLSSPRIGVFDWIDGVVEVRVGWARARPTFCVFNEDLQVLYLFVPPGSIFSYSFETRRSDQVWSFPNDNEYWICKVLPFLYDRPFGRDF